MGGCAQLGGGWGREWGCCAQPGGWVGLSGGVLHSLEGG